MLGSVQAHSAQKDPGSADLPIRYPTAGQRYAPAALREAIVQRQPLVVVFGDSGSGKSALINGVLESADPKQFTVLNFSATSGEFSNVPSFDDILQSACRRLGAVQPTHGRPETLAVLSARVGDLAKKGQTLLLAIDHADHLTVDVIAEVAQLADYLDIPQKHLLRVFVGSMTLASRIDSVLRRLGVDQRLSEIRLSQPSADEVAALIAYEDSTQAGGPRLTPGAIERISAYAKSNLHWAVPMADAARVLAESDGKGEVTADLVRSALFEIWSPEQILSVDPPPSVGLSDSVSRSPGLDETRHDVGQENFFSADPLASKIARKAKAAPRRRLGERAAPVAAISLFVLGTVILSLRDDRLEVAPPQPEPTIEAARQIDPSAPPSGAMQEDFQNSEQGEQVQSALTTGSGEQTQVPVETATDTGPTVPPAEPQGTETAAADPKSLIYGPWPDSADHGHRNDPVVPQDAGAGPSAKDSVAEKPVKAKAPPRKTKTVLQPPESRPDDLTSNHWIQKR